MLMEATKFRNEISLEYQNQKSPLKMNFKDFLSFRMAGSLILHQKYKDHWRRHILREFCIAYISHLMRKYPAYEVKCDAIELHSCITYNHSTHNVPHNVICMTYVMQNARTSSCWGLSIRRHESRTKKRKSKAKKWG